MRVLKEIKEHMKEPIIRLLSYLVLLIVLSVGITVFTDYYIRNHYEKPFEIQIENQNSKKKLADIITRKLFNISSIHKTILLSSNKKQIEVLSKDLNESFEDAYAVLEVLKNGGTVFDVYPVNFYNKDEITEEIFYLKPDNQEISVDVINLSPELVELKQLLYKSTELMLERAGLEASGNIDDFQLVMLIKQAEALLLRTSESANKITYDIQQSNMASEESINQIQNTASMADFLVHTISGTFLILFTLIISFRISVILKTEKLLKYQNIELELEQEKLKIILNKIAVGVVIIDKDKKILWANDNALEMTHGDSIEDLLGTNCFSIMECSKENISRCPYLEDGQAARNIEWSLHKDREKTLPILKSIQHITWNNEDVLLETFVDISEQKEVEAALENSNRDLSSTLEKVKNMQVQLIQSEKMASIGQLAAGVAHEINNPTGFITTNLVTMAEYVQVFKKVFAQLEILKELIAGKNADAVTSTIEMIEKIEEEEDLSFIIDDSFLLLSESSDGARRIKEIVNGLRDFARQDSVPLKESSLNKAIENALKLTANELKYKCKIFKELGDIPNILCHEDQLTQVFVNLFVNASHAFTDQGEISINTRAAGGDVIAEICDTGHGIPEENLTKLFDPFFTTKDVGKGTGLGLSISYGIIEDHGGTIEVESTVGKGTCFTIKIPVMSKG